jgi:hypothetical protein
MPPSLAAPFQVTEDMRLNEPTSFFTMKHGAANPPGAASADALIGAARIADAAAQAGRGPNMAAETAGQAGGGALASGAAEAVGQAGEAPGGAADAPRQVGREAGGVAEAVGQAGGDPGGAAGDPPAKRQKKKVWAPWRPGTRGHEALRDVVARGSAAPRAAASAKGRSGELRLLG